MKEMEDIQKNQMEHLEIKIITIKSKNLLEAINSSLDIIEKK